MTLHSRFYLLVALLFITLPAHAQIGDFNPFDNPLPQAYASKGDFKPEKDAVREIETIRAAPLFPNLPFLYLRAGDELVKGQTIYTNHKSGETSEIESFFLKRDGQYQKIEAREIKGKRVLDHWTSLGFFTWKATRENAEKLWNWSRGANEKITIEQLRKVETALLPDFAEHLNHNWEIFSEFERFAPYRDQGKGPQPIPQPGYAATYKSGDTKRPSPNFVFGGLGYNQWNSTFYAFQMRFSETGVIRSEKAILVGPQVKEIEFGRDYGTPNGPGIAPPKGQRLARLQAQKARVVKFQEIVDKALKSG